MKKIRKATNEEMESIYEMGYDAWGGNMPPEEYIRMCESSGKYKKGVWYVLEETATKIPLSSLIVYDLHVPANGTAKGIGSIATPPQARGNGYASMLVKRLLNQLEKEYDCRTFYLYSDIGADFYERLGFTPLPDHLQKYKDSICMVHAKEITSCPDSLFIPDYF